MSRKVMVFDTETTGTFSKPFCYNVGWVIAEMKENGVFHILEEKEFMVRQVWYNTMLFSTAYYADKKDLYHERIRQHFIEVKRFDELVDIIQKSIEYHNVEIAYAYNSPFDVKVFQFMTDWFKTPNPFAEIPVYDIRAYFMDAVKDSDFFKVFCEENELFTDTGNYSTTAETAYKFLSHSTTFEEEHTALADSHIELEILGYCLSEKVDIFQEMEAPRSLPRLVEKVFTIAYKDKEYKFKGLTARWYKKNNKLIIK